MYDADSDKIYDAWLDYVFIGPGASKPPSEARRLQFNAPHETIVRCCAELFRNPVVAAHRFSRRQLIEGYKYIPSMDGCTKFIFDKSVELEVRKECLHRVYNLFAMQFAIDPLNICYEWWDIFLLNGSYEDNSFYNESEILNELLDLQRRILTIDSKECRESSLLCLGYLMRFMKKESESIIDEFLMRTDLNSHIREFASVCRTGRV
jgi:hypothetical protein